MTLWLTSPQECHVVFEWPLSEFIPLVLVETPRGRMRLPSNSSRHELDKSYVPDEIFSLPGKKKNYFANTFHDTVQLGSIFNNLLILINKILHYYYY